MTEKHTEKTIKKPEPVKGRDRRKQGKTGAVERKVVLTSVEEFANKNRFKLPPEPKKKTKGQPTVVTQEVVRVLEDAFCYDATVEEACLSAGISRSSYYDFLKRCPQFSDRVDELRQAPYLVLRKKLIATAEHDAELSLKVLERKKKQEFSTRTEVAHSGEINDRHSVDPETAALIRKAMGNFGNKIRRDAAVKK